MKSLIALLLIVFIIGCDCQPNEPPHIGENIRLVKYRHYLVEQTPEFDKYVIPGFTRDDAWFVTTDKNGNVLSTWMQ